jgi:nucleoside-diphosphate-sugar epimerase
MAYGRRPPAPLTPQSWGERGEGGLGAARIARFENCYGPEGTHSLRSVQAWTGGREKAPAAICRKVAQAEDSGIIEVWSDGTAIRVFTYVDDLVDGIYTLMQSDPSAGSPRLRSGQAGQAWAAMSGTTDYTDYTDEGQNP